MSAQRWKKWLRRRLNRYSPSAALRWMYRLGFRKGKMRGMELGKQSVPPILNRCMMHNMPTYPRIVQVADGRWIEMWCCPMWAEHTMHDLAMPAMFPDVERSTDKMERPMQTFLHARQEGAGVNTAMNRAIPRRTVRLDSPEQERR
jgi:hypothetical protein